MAYLRLAVGLRDELALSRVINAPKSVRPAAACPLRSCHAALL